jgi:hypothetical protein
MGVRFIILGDFKGQLKPIYDRWQDAMDEKDITKSQFLHEMCGGLEVQLTKYRRGTDALLFKRYTNFYQWADCKDRASVDMAVNEMASFYPYHQGKWIDHYVVMSHKKRMLFNHASNYKLADQQARVLFLAGPKDARGAPGVCMQAQDMLIWEGLDLLCCARKYSQKSPVTGCVYTVMSWTETHVIVKLHEDYVRTAEEAPEDVDDADDEGSEPDDMGEDDNDAPPAPGVNVMEAGVYKLTHARAVAILRLQHALVYASIQGRTMRQKKIGLMDTWNLNFTIRHLIVAVARATEGQYVHIFDKEQGKQRSKDATNMKVTFPDLQKLAAEINGQV